MLTQRQQQIRHRRHHFHYSAPDRAAEYCDERVCLCVRVCVFVCPRSHLRNYTSDLRQFFCARYTYGRGSVILWVAA